MKFTHTDADLKELGNRIKSTFEDTFKSNRDSSCKDLIAVAVSASLLQVSEFKCFQIAYAQWFGHELDERSMEGIFSAYLKDLTIPHWVRHFTRKVFHLEVQGKLNPEDFNIERPGNTRKTRIQGVCYSLLMLIITVVFCIMIVA